MGCTIQILKTNKDAKIIQLMKKLQKRLWNLGEGATAGVEAE